MRALPKLSKVIAIVKLTVFFKKSTNEKISILIVCVDDIILTGDDKEEMERLKKILAKEYEIEDLGQLKYFLGMEVARTLMFLKESTRWMC